MSIFRKDFLSRVKSRETPAKPQEPATKAQNVPHRRPDTVEELARAARAAGHGGPLVVGPSRSSLNSWRDDARALEQEFPEEFGRLRNAQPPKASQEGLTVAVVSSDICQSAESAPAAEPQTSRSAPGSSQTAPEALPVPPPIPHPSAFWQTVLFGSPDSLIPGPDATLALQLVADKLGRVYN